MKLLRVTARNYKNCKDNFTIDFVAKAKKSDEDKLYELQEIAPNLYTYNTVAFVGKNASGKTSAVDLIASCYWILDSFHLPLVDYSYNNVELEFYFFHSGFIYKYTTKIKSENNAKNAFFEDEHIYKKKYYSSKTNKIFDDDNFVELNDFGDLPADTSIIYHVLKNQEEHCICIYCGSQNYNFYDFAFNLIESYNVSEDVFLSIISIFDNNIKGLMRMPNGNYALNYKDKQMEMSAKKLIWFLSSGTTKGIAVYAAMVISLNKGIDLIIDEIENNFHKTLVENMISLYKDPSINQNHATLIFTTHYCELLDLFGRQDNIWITKSDGQVYLENMYEKYKLRTDSIKSKQFYNNTFETAVSYNELMNLRKSLKRGTNI